jgi:hypothetical protein
MTYRALAAVTVAVGTIALAGATELLQNGDFDAAPILHPGQAALTMSGDQLTETDSSQPNYKEAISGIVGWAYSMDKTDASDPTGTDIGLLYQTDLGGNDSSQKLMVNRWDQAVVQTTSATIQAGYTYTLTARCYFPTEDVDSYLKVGKLSLYVGAESASDPSDTGSLKLLGDEKAVSQESYDSDVYYNLNVSDETIVGSKGYVDLKIAYTALAGDVEIGQNLTVGILTAGGSYGKTYWDDVSLQAQAVPEPCTLMLIAGGLAAAARKRRRSA